MSIVLIIIGLLVGGVLAGQSLIYSSRINKIQTEVRQFETAMLTFRDKYSCLPGDCANATMFFGTNSSGCPGGGGTTGTCNGDGNGTINSWNSAGNVETYYLWQQLALSKLYTGPYVAQGGATYYSITPGVNMPSSSFSPNLVYDIYTCEPGMVPNGVPGYDVAIPGVTVVHFGGVDSSSNPDYPVGGGLNGIDAYALDLKFDDGLPKTGRWLASDTMGPSSYNSYYNNCRSGTNYNTVITTGCMMFYALKL